MKTRFWEIDFCRGLAIFGVVIFHFLWDLNYFYDLDIPLYSGFGGFMQKFGSSLFLFLVGLSLVLSNVNRNAQFSKYFIRGIKVLAFAACITVITLFTHPNSYIRFGVLHCIGVSIILAYFFRNLKYLNAVLGVMVILLGNKMRTLTAPNDWFIVFGYTSESFRSVDYFPLLPCFGIVLLGLCAGKILYKGGHRNFQFMNEPKNFLFKGIFFMGRNSLLVYVGHQVVLYGIFVVIKTLF